MKVQDQPTLSTLILHSARYMGKWRMKVTTQFCKMRACEAQSVANFQKNFDNTYNNPPITAKGCATCIQSEHIIPIMLT